MRYDHSRRSRLRQLSVAGVTIVVTAALAVVVVQACTDSLPSAPADVVPRSAASVSPNPNPNCTGVSYTMITTEADSVMAQYGIPSETDTVNICENWVGSDYTMQAVVAGSSENLASGRDTIQAVNYQSGTVTGNGANGGAVASLAVGQTAFDMMNASAAYVRDHTEIADFDIVQGRSVPSHAVITFVNVHLPMTLPTPAVAP